MSVSFNVPDVLATADEFVDGTAAADEDAAPDEAAAADELSAADGTRSCRGLDYTANRPRLVYNSCECADLNENASGSLITRRLDWARHLEVSRPVD
jgi:hypothetical protein